MCLLHSCFSWAVRTHHVALVPAVWVGVCASMRVPPAFLLTGLAAATALLIRPACMSACAYALTSSCLHRSQGPRAWQAWLGPGWSLMYTLCPRLGPSLVWVPTLARVNIHPSMLWLGHRFGSCRRQRGFMRGFGGWHAWPPFWLWTRVGNCCVHGG